MQQGNFDEEKQALRFLGLVDTSQILTLWYGRKK